MFLIWFAVRLPVHNPNAEFNTAFDPARNLYYLAANRGVFILGITLLMIVTLHGASIGRAFHYFFAMRIWYPIAKLIYPIYLFHFPFIVLAAVVVFRTTRAEDVLNVTVWQVGALLVVTMILTLIFSVFMYLFVEQPVSNLRD